MRKTKSENGSAPTVTVDATTTIIMTKIELGIMMLGTIIRVITIAKGSPTTLLLP